jgi:hypothetical protein
VQPLQDFLLIFAPYGHKDILKVIFFSAKGTKFFALPRVVLFGIFSLRCRVEIFKERQVSAKINCFANFAVKILISPIYPLKKQTFLNLMDNKLNRYDLKSVLSLIKF